MNDQLRRENPDYLFGILNYASGFIEQGGDVGMIPEILGETLRLVDLKPDFHHPEIGALYRHGFDLPPAVMAEILALPRETLIADLEAVLRDSIARAPHFFADDSYDDDDDDSGTYFPVHALFLLGELKAEGSLPLVLEVLSQHQDILDMWFGDYLDLHLWESFYHLVEGQLELGRRILVSPGISGRSREVLAEAIA